MITVVIPCYRVTASILEVIAGIGPEVDRIFAIDDACPDNSGDFISRQCDDPRVQVLYHQVNQGVGGAVITGYRAALEEDTDIIIKLDGDGQMDPSLIPYFVEPLQKRLADYTKGNRFYEISSAMKMPKLRLFGNAGLSFLTKLSSGYWNLFDPTNGYTAISARILPYLPLDKISKGYFFESDMLFRLNTLQAVVMDLPADAIYGDEESNLDIGREAPRFALNNLKNFAKRIGYNYFMRGFNYASIELVLGTLLTIFGIVFGLMNWTQSSQMETYASAGTVMLAGLTVMIGVQMLLGFLQYDITNQPNYPFQCKVGTRALTPKSADDEDTAS